MLFYPEGLFGALLARHREMGVGVGVDVGGWGQEWEEGDEKG